MLALSCAAVVPLSACAAQHASPASTPAPVPVAVSPYPSVADYNTLRSARAVVKHALLERNWRRQSFAAYVGLTVIMTMHRPASGRCLDFIAHTYDELLSLHDNYRGEDWAPLISMVRRDPPVTVCRAPRRPRLSASA